MHALTQLIVPTPPFYALDFALELLKTLLFVPNLLQNLGAVGCVQLLDELGHQVGVLERVLDAGQHRPRSLSLLGVCAILDSTSTVAALLDLNLPSEALQVEGAQSIGAQAAALEVLVACDVRVGLQQLRGPAEGVRGHAIACETLEDQERLEGGVCGDASRHAPGYVEGARWADTDRLGRDGSQLGER
jgi:hypothetical protein